MPLWSCCRSECGVPCEEPEKALVGVSQSQVVPPRGHERVPGHCPREPALAGLRTLRRECSRSAQRLVGAWMSRGRATGKATSASRAVTIMPACRAGVEGRVTTDLTRVGWRPLMDILGPSPCCKVRRGRAVAYRDGRRGNVNVFATVTRGAYQLPDYKWGFGIWSGVALCVGAYCSVIGMLCSGRTRANTLPQR